MSPPQAAPAGARGDRHAVVPAAEPRTYYGRPVIKPPVWKPEVPWYFFFGGMAGASAMLAAAAEVAGEEPLARAARRAAGIGAVASPALLVADLGVPSRFANMLRVFRPTSPLNMGTWLLSVFVPNTVGAALLGELDRLPRLRRVAGGASAIGGLAMTTYPAVLLADTAVPVWHEARRELPFVFAGTAGATAGAVSMVVTSGKAGPARRLTLLATAMEQLATYAMDRRLGGLAGPYHEGRAGRLSTVSRALMLAGATVTALMGRRRPGAVAGGALVLGGAACERWAVFRAGFQSAERPTDTVAPQRARVEARDARHPL